MIWTGFMDVQVNYVTLRDFASHILIVYSRILHSLERLHMKLVWIVFSQKSRRKTSVSDPGKFL